MKKVAIIGGGPIGVEAALYGAMCGFDVRLFERGPLCANVRSWSYIGLFTEWARNRSPLAARLLIENGAELAPAQNTSTGGELADYVAQIADLEALRGRVFVNTEIVGLTRERMLKSDFPNDARREQAPFRLILRDENGERATHADVVIDAGGVYATPNPLGNGGALCPGENAARDFIDYALPDVVGRERARFANRHTLVVGSGHSAASTLRSLGDLFAVFPQTRATWVVRREVPPHGAPYTLDPNESSPHREALHRRANEMANDARVSFRPRTVVEEIEYSKRDQTFCVTLNSLQNGVVEFSEIVCDNIACHTGFRPNRALWSELQMLEHPATGGPFSLGAALLAANQRAGVGLSTGYAERISRGVTTKKIENNDAEPPIESVGDERNDARLLWQNEPNFFVVGIKSYGRDAGFLMQNGFRQVRDVYKIVAENPHLDLYGGALD